MAVPGWWVNAILAHIVYSFWLTVLDGKTEGQNLSDIWVITSNTNIVVSCHNNTI